MRRWRIRLAFRAIGVRRLPYAFSIREGRRFAADRPHADTPSSRPPGLNWLRLSSSQQGDKHCCRFMAWKEPSKDGLNVPAAQTKKAYRALYLNRAIWY